MGSKKVEERKRDAVAKEMGVHRMPPAVRTKLEETLGFIDEAIISMSEFDKPPTREAAIAITKLEEAQMWIDRGLDRDEEQEQFITEELEGGSSEEEGGGGNDSTEEE